MSRLVAVLLVLASGAHASGSTLPKDTDPRGMALATDGAVWVTGDYAGLTRVAPNGATQEFLRRDDGLSDLVAGPNGSVWLSSSRGLVRIDASGRVMRVPADFGGSAAGPASDAGIWLADEGDVVRIGADGTSRAFTYRPPRDAFDPTGLAQGPDGSVWFTESGLHHRWIGRMTAAGAFTHWPVPRSVGEPGRIAAASDGTAWFTGRHVIARIDAGGRVTSFRLGGEAAPHDVVAGTDGAIWFASDACLGRVTAAGSITTWPLAGAMRIERLAAAPDGTFWLMDRVGNAIRHVDPSAAAPGPCGAPTLTRSAGVTSATLALQRYDDDFFGDLHVHIARRGKPVFSEAVPGIGGAEARTDGRSLVVRDLDGDGEPEVMLTVNWNGTQCCSWSRIYSYDRARDTYVVHQHFWSYFGAEPVLRDLDGDRRPELLSIDSRFFERFAHESFRPLQIWSYRRGKLRDVTRRYPRLVRRDAAKLWSSYLKYRKTYARGVLPAWMADEYRLGRKAYADRVLEQAAARGELEHSYGYKPHGVPAFIVAVEQFLRAGGYLR